MIPSIFVNHVLQTTMAQIVQHAILVFMVNVMITFKERICYPKR